MYFLLKMGIFHCYVSLPEGTFQMILHKLSADALHKLLLGRVPWSQDHLDHLSVGSEFDSDAEDPKGGGTTKMFVEIGGVFISHIASMYCYLPCYLLGGGFKCLLFSTPKIWEMIQFDFRIFFNWVRETTN